MFQTVSKIIKWTGERKKRVYLGFLCSFLQHLFIAFPIMGAAYLIELMIKDSQKEIVLKPIWALYIFIFMAITILGRFLFGYFKSSVQESIAYEKTAEERIEIGNILKRVSLGFFDANRLGEISGSVTTDLSVFEMYAMKMTDTLVGGYIHAGVMILCLCVWSWQAAGIALLGILCSGLALRQINHKSAKNQPIHQEAQDALISSVIEYIRGISVVKSYGQQGVSIKAIHEACRAHHLINVKIEWDYVLSNIWHRLSLNLASVGVMGISAYLTLQGQMTLSICLMLIIFSFCLFASVEQINNSAHTMEMLEVAFKKIEKIKQADFLEETNKPQLPKNHTIVFDQVSFGYDQRRVINQVSLTIPEGKTTAIVGPSGSGKTTLCHLMSRFYEVSSGAITMGGVPIKQMNSEVLLNQFSMVFQNVYLFHDTILNNIRFGNPSASLEDVYAAARKACCHDFIMSLPQGYDTIIGEGGSSLSGGEKQIISIARDILIDAPIIILDEATASVDPENEHLIQQAISELAKGKTMIVIAHRLATIEQADHIIVLDQGKVSEQGTHDDLMKKEGLYKRFIDIRGKAESWQMESVL